MKTPQTIYLKDWQPSNFTVEKVDLTFEIERDHTTVTSIVNYKKNLEIADEITPLVLDMKEAAIIEVIANGMVLLPHEYETSSETFKLLRTPDEFELEIKCRLKPGENTTLEGLYQSGEIICTQCEAQGFRRIIPFLDRPDIMAPYTCTLIADKKEFPVLLSNGNLVKSGDLENGRHYARWEDPFNKPSYLFALVAGDLAHIHDTFETVSGRQIDLKIYSEKENIDQCRHAMTSLKQAMKWDEERFGLEYDLDLYQIVAINDFNAGAMENKGLNIFNSKYVLARPETATDDDFMGIQGVIGHEYFHNWTGNRVTLKNWFQLSLKEGLTVFRDQEFSSDLNSRGVKRISSIRNLRAFQFPEDTGPMTHPVRPESYIEMNNFYTTTVYEKGAELVRMIHQLIGEGNFQKGMKIYFDAFDGKAVTIEDFVWAMEKASLKDLSHFRLWYSQSGTPTVKISRSYDVRNQCLQLTLEQSVQPDRNQEEKLPLHIPVKMGLLDPDGNEMEQFSDTLIELTAAKETFRFDNVPKGSRPSVFRQFSAPVKIQTDYTDEDLAFFMAHDTDEFNRWDAAQTLFINEIFHLVEDYINDQPLEVASNLIAAFENALNDTKSDNAFLAKMLALPTEMEIKDHFAVINVEAIHTVRKALERQIAEKLEDQFIEIIRQTSQSDPLSLSHEAMADRSLKNICLTYLGSLQSKQSIKSVKTAFSKAKNMTDELAAFKILSEITPETKKWAVDSFYTKWAHDKLVLDKWFSIQAASTLPDTMNEMQLLLKHPDFSMKNPNKVRSLIYMFALFNPIHFHKPDGSGYHFIADTIIELDTINHQIAARLSGCFNHWKKYDDERKALMKKELQRILNVKALSKNVFEIVSRALE